jgi:hypothetical protein
MNNNQRTNPFRSTEKINFPPLDGFFLHDSRPPIHNTRSSPDKSFTSAPCHDFSMNMSIAGRAAMAEHNHQVRRYGIDNSIDNAANDRSSISDSDDWGILMDDTCSIASFASSAFFNRSSRDRSKEDADTSVDVSSSYFDKSVINSLLTPEKVRATVQNSPSVRGVTLRGTTDDDESPVRSSECCTNASSCSGVEEMFHAALRFHDDLQESILSMGDSNGKDKSSSISFAADTSFLSTIDGRSVARRKTTTDNNAEGLNFLFGSPINKHDNDESFAVNSSFLGSPISPSFSRVANEMKQSPPSVELSGTPSPQVLNTTPLRAGRHVTIEDQSSFASLLGLTPVKPELEHYEATPKKNLFQNEEPEPATIECSITEESIELIRHTPTKPKTWDRSDVLLQPRVFGLNAENRLNLCTTDNADSPVPAVVRKSDLLHRQIEAHVTDENVRGVRLCRASKLKLLGLENLCHASTSFDNNDSADRSDF